MDNEALPNSTCAACGVTGQVSRFSKTATESIRGRDYEVQKVVRRCGNCGEEFENTQDPDWRPAVYARYRADLGMVTPEAMVAFRKTYDLRQEEVANLLGWGEATLGRYERGSLQSAAHDKSLASLIAPGGLAEAIEANPSALLAERRANVLARLRVEGGLLSPENLKAVRAQRGLTIDDADTLVSGKRRWHAWENGTGLQSASEDRLVRLMSERADMVDKLREMASGTHVPIVGAKAQPKGPLKLSHPLVISFRQEVTALGLKEDAVRKLLPPWWSSAEQERHSMISARAFIASHFGAIVDSSGRLAVGTLPEARFKTLSGTTAAEIQAARAVATAVARIVSKASRTVWKGALPDVAAFREQVVASNSQKWVDFESLAVAAWEAGIPVVFLPQPPVTGRKMDGMATFVDGRPVIVLCRNQKLSDWMLFVLAHELGHIACRHLPENDGAAVLDEKMREAPEEPMRAGSTVLDHHEAEANDFAQCMLVADGQTLAITDAIPPAAILAKEAMEFGLERGISPGHVILNAVRHTPSPPFDLNGLGMSAAKLVDELLKRPVTQDICKMLSQRYLRFSLLHQDDILFLEKLGVV